MTDDTPNVSQALSSLPLGDLIRDVAIGLADGQLQLDRAAMDAAAYMSGSYMLRDPDTGLAIQPDGSPTNDPVIIDSKVQFGFDYDAQGRKVPQSLSMMELGFVPNFYQFVDTAIEMKLSLRIRKQLDTGEFLKTSSDETKNRQKWRGRQKKGRSTVSAQTLDARYASSYGYDAALACTLSTKIVPVPPPAILEERIRAVADLSPPAKALVETILLSLPKIPSEEAIRESAKGVSQISRDTQRAPGDGFTLEAWIWVPEQGSPPGTILTGGEPEDSAPAWMLGITDLMQLSLQFSIAGENDIRCAFRTPLRAGQWSHVAIIAALDDIRLFQDGRMDGGCRAPSAPLTGDSVQFGTKEDADPTGVALDGVRLWNGVRTRQKLQDLTGFSLVDPLPDDLLLQWQNGGNQSS